MAKNQKRLENEAIRATAIQILEKDAELHGVIRRGCLSEVDGLEAIAGIERPKQEHYFSSNKWRRLRAIALIAPKYGIAFPTVRTQTKRQLIKAYPTLKIAVAGLSEFEAAIKIKPKKSPQPSLIKAPDKINAFYRSYAWRKLRYSVLQKWGRKCMLCGQTEGIMHGDHIKPLRKYWSLRLDFENIQILCEVCNHGKGNWDETDWRPKVEPELKPEIKPTRVGLLVMCTTLILPIVGV